jgi:peptide chain release factor subunit 1
MELLSSQDGVFNEDNKERLISIDIEPPQPIKKNGYFCDKRFHTEYIETLFQTYDKNGIAMINGEDFKLCIIEGTNCKILCDSTIHRQKKQKKGGQSAPRIQRLREEQINAYVKKVVEAINRVYYNHDENRLIIKCLVITGIGDIKKSVYTHESLLDDVKNKVHLMNCENDNIHECIKKTEHIFMSEKDKGEMILLESFYENINLNTGLGVFGINEVHKYLDNNIKEIYIHIDNQFNIVSIKENENMYGYKIHYIALKTSLGCSFLKDFDGIGATLRYIVYQE